jgi:predicted HAD superfamily Cof-like phosphohydrolase
MFYILKNQILFFNIIFMKKIDALNQVSDFHKTFEAPILETPQIPSSDRCQLRISLLQEELDELSEAISKGDIVEVADALCDLQYVLSGAVLEFGLGDKFNKLFNEVQRSNMSKACNSQKEALETLLHYKKKDGTEGHYKNIGEKWVVYRNGDKKVLKSINYSPANLKKIIEK